MNALYKIEPSGSFVNINFKYEPYNLQYSTHVLSSNLHLNNLTQWAVPQGPFETGLIMLQSYDNQNRNIKNHEEKKRTF